MRNPVLAPVVLIIRLSWGGGRKPSATRECRAQRPRPHRASCFAGDAGAELRSRYPTIPPSSRSVSLRSSLLALVLFGSVLAPQAGAQAADAPLPFDSTVLRGRLPNGLRYLIKRNSL